jgi:lysophospholipase L1-like esterase
VALRDKEASIIANSSRPLMFNGNTAVTIPPGVEMVSDPVALTVPPFADLAIDVYLPDDTAAMKSPITTHAASWQTNFVSKPGNHVGTPNLPVATTTQYRRADGVPTSSWFFLSRVEVVAPAQTRAVVTIGDSITDGTHSGIDTNNRWPDHLAKRLAQQNIKMSVLNIGIGGNRLLGDGNGLNALARFDRDVLGQPGVTHLIVLEGINDIGFVGDKPNPSAADLIAAHQQIIERARAHGIKVIGATLTPFEGAFYYTLQGEAKRKALNDWIRTGKMYDAVVDFDAVIRDPSHPTKALAKYDSGDHLHPNPAGYAAMANAIDLALLKPASGQAQTASR